MKKTLLLISIITIILLGACSTRQAPEILDDSEFKFIEPRTSFGINNSFDYKNLPLKFDIFNIYNGLSSNVVNEIIQDQYGIIWIATYDGLNKYDGNNIITFKHNFSDANSLVSNVVWTVFEDSDGDIWVGTDGGLEKYDRNTNGFEHFAYDSFDENSISNNFVRTIFEDSRGKIWIGTLGGGLSQFDKELETFKNYLHNEDSFYSISSNIVRSIFEDSRGLLWVGTWNGLDRFDYETESFFHFKQEIDDAAILSSIESRRGIRGYNLEIDLLNIPFGQYQSSNILAGNKITSITEDVDGFLWIGTFGGGLMKFDPFSGNFTNFQYESLRVSSLSDNNIFDVFVDKQNNLWIASNNGLNLLDQNSNHFTHYQYDSEEPTDVFSPNAKIINNIYQDNSGMFWISTNGGGINTFSAVQSRFEHVYNDPSKPASLSSNMVWSFYEDSDGTLWIGTDQGVDMLREGRELFVHFDPHPEALTEGTDDVYVIKRDSTGMLWLGTSRGLSRFNYIENEFVSYTESDWFNADVEIDLGNISITSIEEDSHGNFWLGTYGQGLLKLIPSIGKITRFVYEEENLQSINSNIVNNLLWDQDGNLWIATIGGGLNRLDGSEQVFQHFLHDVEDQNSISDNNITSLALDDEGFIWVGTFSGLNRFDAKNNTFTNFGIQNGLPSDSISTILIDDLGYIWISTSNGLSRFDPATELFINYSYRDGLQSNDFLSGSGEIGLSGALYFGGINGYNKFYPDQLIGNTYEPQIVITSLTRSGAPIEINQSIEEIEAINLKWPENYFEFEFSALNFVQPEKNEYAYKMENFDNDWNYVSNRSYGRYTNLPPGDYVLRLIGSNNDGVWNTEGKNLFIRVIPVWWETQWFRISAVLIVSLVVASIYRLQIGRVERFNRKLSQEVQERTLDIEKRRKVADGLREILIRLNSNLPVEESIDFIACQAQILLSARSIVIFELKGNKKNKILAVFPKDASCIDETDISISDSKYKIPIRFIDQLAQQIKNKKHVTLEYLNIDSGENELFTAAPIYLGKGIFGGLVIKHGEIDIRHEELELLKSFADQVGLAIGNDQLQKRALEMAVVTERNRIARDLHDAITQTLFSANLVAETIMEIWDKDRPKAMELITELRQLNQSALAEMRTLLLELRPASVIETDISVLLNQLSNVLRGRAGCQVKLKIDGHCRLPEGVHVGVYRIAQEAITNIMKHSNARNVHIQLECKPKAIRRQSQQTRELTLKIQDDGIGFIKNNTKSNRFGLNNMRERAKASNLELKIESGTGKGTKVIVRWKESEEI